MALGEIGLEYRYFMSLTPRLWAYLCRGYTKKMKDESFRLAWLAAHIINISGKTVETPVAPSELLPQKQKKKAVRETPKKKGDLSDILKGIAL